MNADERRTARLKAQRMVKQNIEGLGLSIAGLARERDALRAKLAQISGQSQFTVETRALESAEARRMYAAKMAKDNKYLHDRLAELRTLLEERDSLSDLSSPELANAIQAAKLVRPDVPGEGFRNWDAAASINELFIGDQKALQMLRLAYASSGLKDPGGLDKYLYDAAGEVGKLERLADAATAFDGSLNIFAGQLAAFGKMEGIEGLDTTPDQAGALEAMRRAAGLPENSPALSEKVKGPAI